ncbi:hypothetical protein AOQ84DRAFT_83450 [Glonium stellatum]|uniref:Uncharacterized protein n=1 Tax=Glonium stellatum TaxID=574774 RepID=A0A8E2JQR5_9PEZI|nr:hypothetical protein AOQ84DRAFT_83450 [Glonium stellatum]
MSQVSDSVCLPLDRKVRKRRRGLVQRCRVLGIRRDRRIYSFSPPLVHFLSRYRQAQRPWLHTPLNFYSTMGFLLYSISQLLNFLFNLVLLKSLSSQHVSVLSKMPYSI